MTEHALVIRGGGVIDPAQGLDAVTDVAIQDGRVAAVGSGLRGRVALDAAGCAAIVVAPNRSTSSVAEPIAAREPVMRTSHRSREVAGV